ncbi:nucleotidyltransferase domain-containing protein [Candidatus Pacearchaeota archaeon]|nr:nucleotidyltransferase domain-containing protein [Candidatus Pacearchaeota archaeon]
MLENNNRYKLLKVFLENPLDSFRLRELSRIVKISPPSVMAYLKEFDNEELVIKFEKRGIPFYKANRENEKFIVYKKISIIYEIYSCGIVNEIWDKLAPQAIILYGSHVKGEAIDDSDIDMFAITNNKNVKRMDNKAMDIDLKKYEELLNKEIHLMTDNVKNIPNELKNNLVNGVVLKGYFKVF